MDVASAQVISLNEYRKRRSASDERRAVDASTWTGAMAPVTWVRVMLVPCRVPSSPHGQAV